MAYAELIAEIEERIVSANERYGDFASTHEALGVALEEWHELIEAIHGNNLKQVEHECLDISAVLIRLARDLRANNYVKLRSVK